MRNSITSIVVAALLASCSAAWGQAPAQPAQTTQPAQPAQTTQPAQPAGIPSSSVKEQLQAKVQADISKVQAELAKTNSLTESIKLSSKLAEFREVLSLLREPGSVVDPARDVDIAISRDVDELNNREIKSYTQYAGESFDKLVPVYAGDEVEKPVGFGRVYTQAMNLAESEKGEVATVKVAVINRLQEAHTRAVLGQDQLHVPEYTRLLQQAPRDEQVIEVIQAERLKDEATIEALENPGFFGRLWWWWHS